MAADQGEKRGNLRQQRTPAEQLQMSDMTHMPPFFESPIDTNQYHPKLSDQWSTWDEGALGSPGKEFFVL